MKRFWGILAGIGLLFLLGGCTAARVLRVPAALPVQSAAPVHTPPPAPVWLGYVEHEVTVGEDVYTVRMCGAPGQYIMSTDTMVLTRVELYRNGDFSAPFQTLAEYDPSFMDTLPMAGEFLVQDINFDGYTDFCYESLDYRGNLEMEQALWDPDTGRFALSSGSLPNAVYDAGTGLVYGFTSGGLGGYSRTVGHWEGDTLTPLFYFWLETWNPANRWYTYLNGEQVLTKEWTGEVGELGERLLFPGAEPYAALTAPPEAVDDPLDGEYSVWRLVDMGPDRPVYAAKLVSEYTNPGPGEAQNALTRLEIYLTDDLTVPIQTIPLEGGNWYGAPGTDFNFTVEDLNFDGWPDIRFFHLMGTNNPSDYCVLYDPASGRFARSAALEDITFLEPDAAHRVIRGWLHGVDYNDDSLYRWINGELVEVRRVRNALGGRTRTTTAEFK